MKRSLTKPASLAQTALTRVLSPPELLAVDPRAYSLWLVLKFQWPLFLPSKHCEESRKRHCGRELACAPPGEGQERLHDDPGDRWKQRVFYSRLGGKGDGLVSQRHFALDSERLADLVSHELADGSLPRIDTSTYLIEYPTS